MLLLYFSLPPLFLELQFTYFKLSIMFHQSHIPTAIITFIKFFLYIQIWISLSSAVSTHCYTCLLNISLNSEISSLLLFRDFISLLKPSKFIFYFLGHINYKVLKSASDNINTWIYQKKKIMGLFFVECLYKYILS